jgi:hypothetical protein
MKLLLNRYTTIRQQVYIGIDGQDEALEDKLGFYTGKNSTVGPRFPVEMGAASIAGRMSA